MIHQVGQNERIYDPYAAEELGLRVGKEITESAPKPLLIAEQQAREATRLVQISREPVAPRNPTVALLEERFKEEILDVNDFRGDLAVTVRPDRLQDICRSLKEDPTTK